jgi:threonine dehydratase
VLEDVPEADIVLVCCGGGGLLAGVSSAIKSVKPEVKIYGVEPETACGVYQSFQVKSLFNDKTLN